MAHEITVTDKVAFSGTPAWHGIGHVSDHMMTVLEAAQYAGLTDWDVAMEAVYLVHPRAAGIVSLIKEGHQITPEQAMAVCSAMELVPNRKASVRQDSRVCFEIMTDGYAPITNQTIIDFFSDICSADDHVLGIESAGSLFGGARVWMLAALDGTGTNEVALSVNPHDKIKRYVLLATSHDGSLSIHCHITPVRVVCNNTLTMATSAYGVREGLVIRHTHNAGERLQQARYMMGLASKRYQTLEAVWNFLSLRSSTVEQVKAMVETLVPLDPEAKRPTRTLNRREAIMDLYTDDPTNNMDGIAGTWWAAYNAVTEYVDHFREGRSSAGPDATEAAKTRSRKENKLVSVVTGTGAMMKQQALSYSVLGAAGRAFCPSPTGAVQTFSSEAGTVTVDGTELFQALLTKTEVGRELVQATVTDRGEGWASDFERLLSKGSDARS